MEWTNKRKGIAAVAMIAIIAASVGVYAGWTLSHYHFIHVYDILTFGTPVEGDGLDIKGFFTIIVDYDSDGKIDLFFRSENLFTNGGRAAIRHMIADQTWVNNNASTNAWHWIAIGTGSGQGAGDNTLATEFDRQVGTDAYPSAYNFTITYQWTAGAFDDDTISEMGLFNAAAGGTMLNYHDFTGINLQSGDSLQVVSEIQVGS